MLNTLLLLSKNDIPFPQARVNIHQPTLKEIGYIGEESFFIGCQFLTLSKNNVNTDQDLGSLNNFDIFIRIINEKSEAAARNKECAQQLLLLLFPNCDIRFLPNAIGLIPIDTQDKKILIIDKTNFDIFQEILREMFCLREIFQKNGSKQYDPVGKRAQALAQKFKKYHQKLAELKKTKGEGQKVEILSRYLSILAVGENKNINSLLDYSVYQLFDQFQRFSLKEESDIYIQAKMAGAQNLKDVKNWMGDIHSDIDV